MEVKGNRGESTRNDTFKEVLTVLYLINFRWLYQFNITTWENKELEKESVREVTEVKGDRGESNRNDNLTVFYLINFKWLNLLSTEGISRQAKNISFSYTL